MKTEILLECNNEDLNFYETAMIKAHDTLAPYGYNLTTGGEGNKHFFEETRRKLSESNYLNLTLEGKMGQCLPNKELIFLKLY